VLLPVDWPLCGKKRVGKVSSHNRCLFGKFSSDPISYLISTDIMWLVREAVCKGLITRSQLNEGFMYRMEMSSSSHLRASSPFPLFYFQLNTMNTVVDKSFMHFSLDQIHYLGHIQPGIHPY
jgi:hypothetical protein